MKSIFLALLFAITGLGLNAQSLEKATDLLSKSKKVDAKAEIDKYLAIDKHQKEPDAWYDKCKIYAAIGEDSVLKQQYPDALAQSLEALKKYTELDEVKNKEKDKQFISLKLDNYKPINAIYAGFFQAGAANYNSGKYSESLEDFKNTLNARDFMFSKGWVTVKFDTISTLYAGITAEKAKKRDEAASYYSQLADAKVNDPRYIDIYKWLINYYTDDESDEADAKKYLKLAREVYPNEKSWGDFELGIYDAEIDAYRKKGNKDSLFAEYLHVIGEEPNNYIFTYNYGVELYNYAVDTTTGKLPANSDSLIGKAKEELNKSLQLKPDYVQAILLLGKITYNQSVDLRASTKNIKGQTPADKQKRIDIRNASSKILDESIPYFEKVDQILGPMGKLKQEDRMALKDAYDFLINIYDAKNVKDKSLLYTNKYNDVDKVHD
jgi:hypothetical protein